MNHPDNPARDYVASLTGLRGVAALFVFLFHYGSLNPDIRLDLTVPVIGSALQFPLGLGFAGVDLFFVLSGFLLSLPFAMAALSGSADQPLKPYYRRRLLRVFPAYYAQFAIIMLGGAWFVTWRPLEGAPLLAHMVMLFNVGWEPVRPLVGLWWTLPVELSFYLLLPVIATFMRPGRWPFLLLPGIALSLVYRTWSADHFAADVAGSAWLAASHLPGVLPEFLLGASAAMLVQFFHFKSIERPSARMLDFMFAGGCALAAFWLWEIVLSNGAHYWQGHWSMIIAPLALGLPLSLMVLGLYWGSPLGRLLLANRVVYFLGLVSYSLYLWHFVVLQQLSAVFGERYENLPGMPKFLLTSATVMLVASVSYYLFERPFFRLRGFSKARNRRPATDSG